MDFELYVAINGFSSVYNSYYTLKMTMYVVPKYVLHILRQKSNFLLNISILSGCITLLCT